MTNQVQNSRRNASNGDAAEENETLEGNTSIGFSLPIAMKVEIEKAALAANKAPNTFVRELVAQSIGYALPASKTARGSKYDSPEAKKAAQQAAAKEHREKMAELLNRSRREAGVPVPEKTAKA